VPLDDVEKEEMQKSPCALVVGSGMYTQVCICPSILFYI